MKRLIGFGLTLAIVAVAGATAVEANCIPAQIIGTNGFLIWYNGSPYATDVSEFVGNFWNTGNKAGVNGDATISKGYSAVSPAPSLPLGGFEVCLERPTTRRTGVGAEHTAVADDPRRADKATGAARGRLGHDEIELLP